MKGAVVKTQAYCWGRSGQGVLCKYELYTSDRTMGVSVGNSLQVSPPRVDSHSTHMN